MGSDSEKSEMSSVAEGKKYCCGARGLHVEHSFAAAVTCQNSHVYRKCLGLCGACHLEECQCDGDCLEGRGRVTQR